MPGARRTSETYDDAASLDLPVVSRRLTFFRGGGIVRALLRPSSGRHSGISSSFLVAREWPAGDASIMRSALACLRRHLSWSLDREMLFSSQSRGRISL